jgi:NADH-quinone oxidoreductase subunit H
MTFYDFLRDMIVGILSWFAGGVNWLLAMINWDPLSGFSGWVGGIVMGPVSINLLTVLAAIITVLVVVFINLIFMMWFELKLFARFYHGRGPTEVGYAGLLQNFAHGIKLFVKELITPKKADKWAYLIAPIIYIGTAFAVFAAIPWTEGFYLGQSDLQAGFLLVFALFSMAPFMIFVAGWASNNKFSLIGGMRSASQMISYEVPLLLSVVGVVLLAQSLSLTEIVHAQNLMWLNGFLPGWFIFLQPVAAVLFFTAIVAELERIPFDLPEAEAELVEGWKTEYGGLRFGLLMFTEWTRAFAGCGLFVLLFLGGWQGPLTDLRLFGIDLGPVVGVIWFFVKTYLVFAVMVWVRASLPRVRIDQLLKICWNTLLPLGLVNIIATVITFMVWQAFGLELAVGFSLLSFGLIALYFFLGKPVEPEPCAEDVDVIESKEMKSGVPDGGS